MKEFGEWVEVGASHVSFNTMGAGLKGVDTHIAALQLAISSVQG